MNVGANIFGSPSGEPKHHNQTNAQKKCEKLLTLPVATARTLQDQKLMAESKNLCLQNEARSEAISEAEK
jgi:hypothetical protein